MYSSSINNLIEALKKLPSVGQRTAERFVFYWLKSGKKEVNELREALNNLLQNTKSCEVCWNFDDISPCRICEDIKRQKETVCVVSETQDLAAIENTREYSGLYHVLRGNINADDTETEIKNLKIEELKNRIKQHPEIKEIILALSPDLAGETTMMYLKKELLQIRPDLKITRLARGLPLGSDLQYADEITLISALKNRN
ncbi:MAG TPA: recombination mediator RecR [Candidatus Magasanikbacteria bacterium]|nr:recombination mediator RecR [Candidatus Magasanikbacteria bacterium]